MAIEIEKQVEIFTHPLWEQYKEIQNKLKEANACGYYELVEPLENRLTELTLKIGNDLDLISLNRFSDNDETP